MSPSPSDRPALHAKRRVQNPSQNPESRQTEDPAAPKAPANRGHARHSAPRAQRDKRPGERVDEHVEATCCAAQTPRLTPGRRAVLDLLERERRAVGAYEMIDLMHAIDGRRPAPTQVYRALDFLVDHGLAHRLASRNAYLACGRAHGAREPVAFLICERCGRVEEAISPGLGAAVKAVAAVAGFDARAEIIEIAGVCAACAA